MKTVYFLRHGKAEKRTKELSDLRRALTPKGRKEVRSTAKTLSKKHSPVIDLIISSPAMRAMESTVIFMETLGLYELPVFTEELLFTIGSYNGFLDLLLSLDDSKSNALVVAHNPVLSDIVQLFIPEMKAVIPTAGIIGLRFAVDSWNEITHVQPNIVYSDIKKKKVKKMSLSRLEKNEVKERTISFIITTLKELNVDIERNEIPEEILNATNQGIFMNVVNMIDEVRRVSKRENGKQRQSA